MDEVEHASHNARVATADATRSRDVVTLCREALNDAMSSGWAHDVATGKAYPTSAQPLVHAKRLILMSPPSKPRALAGSLVAVSACLLLSRFGRRLGAARVAAVAASLLAALLVVDVAGQLRRVVAEWTYECVVEALRLIKALRQLNEVRLARTGLPMTVASVRGAAGQVPPPHEANVLRQIVQVVSPAAAVGEIADSSTSYSLPLLVTWVGTWCADRIRDADAVLDLVAPAASQTPLLTRLRGVGRVVTLYHGAAAARERLRSSLRPVEAEPPAAAGGERPAKRSHDDVDAALARVAALVFMWKRGMDPDLGPAEIARASQRLTAVLMRKREGSPSSGIDGGNGAPDAGDLMCVETRSGHGPPEAQGEARGDEGDTVASARGVDPHEPADPRAAMPRRRMPGLPTALLQRRREAAADTTPPLVTSGHTVTVGGTASAAEVAVASPRDAVRSELTDLFRFRERANRWTDARRADSSEP